MSLIVFNNTDGSVTYSLPENTLTTIANIDLIGEGYRNYGIPIAENQIKTLENFANTTSPVGGLTGQLWYDKSNNIIKVNSGSPLVPNWQQIGGATVLMTPPPMPSIGMLWFDSSTSKFNVWNGSSWIAIGPVSALSQLFAAPSSMSGPGFSFLGDTDTGIFSSSANNIDFATAGINRLSITSSGLIQVQTPNYESLVSNDNDIPNKKFNDAAYVNVVGDIMTGNLSIPSLNNSWISGTRNFFINGAFDVWQRASSFSISGKTFTSDHWRARRENDDPGMLVTQRPGINDSIFSIRIRRNLNDMSLKSLMLSQQIESFLATRLENKNIFISVDAQAGSGYSATTLACSVFTGDGINESFDEMTGFATNNSSMTSNNTITTSATRLVFGPFLIPTTTKEIVIMFKYTPISAIALPNDYFELANAQVEIDTATPYNVINISDELNHCKRYFSKIGYEAFGQWVSSSSCGLAWTLPIEMRTIPILSLITATPQINDSLSAPHIGTLSSIVFSRVSKSGGHVKLSGFTGAPALSFATSETPELFSLDSEL